MGKRYFEENLQRSYTALNTEKALKYFAIISVLLHLGFNLKKSSRMITLEQKLHNWYPSAKKGALMLETHLKIQVTLPELAEDRQAHAGGFTKARAMSQAQPARCFLAFHTVITKLIRSGGILCGISYRFAPADSTILLPSLKGT